MSDSGRFIHKELILPILWIFILVNMAYADILSLMDATSPIARIMNGAPLPDGGLVAGAIVMELPIIMIVLSYILSGRLNFFIHLPVCILTALFVIRGGHGGYYIIFALIEVIAIAATLYIAWHKAYRKEALNGV